MERLQNAWDSSAASTESDQILVGSDCPLITPALLNDTAEFLRQGFSVIGPSPAGGFYLLGLPKQALSVNFGDSLESPLEAVSLAQSLAHLKLRLLPYLPDVDTEEDLVSLKAILELKAQEADERTEEIHLPKRTLECLSLIEIERSSSDTRLKRPVLDSKLRGQ